MQQSSRQYRRLSISTLFGLFLVGWLASAAHAQQDDAASESGQQLIPHNLLGLIHAPEVHQELELSAAQVAKLEAFFEANDGRWFRARNLPPEKSGEVISQLEAEAVKWFQANTTEQQLQRLGQLELRAQGVRMLLRKDVAQRLAMDDSQTSRLLKLAEVTEQKRQELQKATLKNAVTDELQNAFVNAEKAERDAAFANFLSSEQRKQLDQLLGAPFDTTQLKRIYPMAPDLVPVPDWINSKPVSLKQLRGKVVILHFYAFQCHNCRANFDVYRRWHDKFGDDVVVIGIQTPETAKERDPTAVKLDAEQTDLQFPILVDLKSENWQTWSNTMWPTVYVIDKDGYLRQWWQGELRWQGATGDQKIEQLVEELLAE